MFPSSARFGLLSHHLEEIGMQTLKSQWSRIHYAKRKALSKKKVIEGRFSVAPFAVEYKSFYIKADKTGYLVCIKRKFLVAPPHFRSALEGPCGQV